MILTAFLPAFLILANPGYLQHPECKGSEHVVSLKALQLDADVLYSWILWQHVAMIQEDPADKFYLSLRFETLKKNFTPDKYCPPSIYNNSNKAPPIV